MPGLLRIGLLTTNSGYWLLDSGFPFSFVDLFKKRPRFGITWAELQGLVEIGSRPHQIVLVT